MLQVPDNYNIVSILAIDPGLNYTGVAHYQVDNKSKEILSIDSLTINTNTLKNTRWIDQEIHNERTIKLIKLKDAIQEIVLRTNPQIVVFENNFYNPSMPTAYKALIESVLTIKVAIMDINNNIPFTNIEPLLIKKTVGALKGVKGKEVVKEAIMNINEISNLILHDIDTLDEHSVDAIAIGYTFLKLSMEI